MSVRSVVHRFGPTLPLLGAVGSIVVRMTNPRPFPAWHADPRLPVDRPFTTGEAQDLGADGNMLARLVRQGILRRVVRGVYVDAALPDSILHRARALSLAVPEAAVITDETAAWLYGVDLYPPGDRFGPMPRLQFFRFPDRTRVRRTGVRSGRRMLEEVDLLLSLDGIVATTPLRTACDLGRTLRRERALAAMDALLHLGDFTEAELAAQVERFRGRRGVVQLRDLVPLADGRSESVRESELRLLWIDAGLPKPELQIPVSTAPGRGPFRLDLGDSKVKYAAEYDGEEWHSTPEQVSRDGWRRELIREQGWTIDVFRDADLQAWNGAVRLREGYRRAAERSKARLSGGWSEAEQAARAFGRPHYAEDFLAPDDESLEHLPGVSRPYGVGPRFENNSDPSVASWRHAARIRE